MENQLEHIRDIWVKAFFDGDYDVLRRYESDDFKVVYEQEDRVESNFTRYDRIAHAVLNGVWKPRKLDVDAEEYEFNENQDHCRVLISMEQSNEKMLEIWVFQEDWKITELRFLKD